MRVSPLHPEGSHSKPAATHGCNHHKDGGSQYAPEVYGSLLADHGLVGSMGGRGNPFDNAKAESFMKTLKVEASISWRRPRGLCSAGLSA